MPRKPRVYLPGVPSHIVQRGVDRAACFFADDDYRFYLQCLKDACQRYSVKIHAYVLMTNHVHLLMTPSTAEGISRVMQLVGNRYVQYINKRYRRTGTLWEGRHRSSLIDAEKYLLGCYRYIELNPVRADMVVHAGDYPWSSYRYHAMGEPDPLIVDHEVFIAIDTDQLQRQRYYQALSGIALDDRDIHDIRRAVTFSQSLGNDRFKEQVEMMRRRIGESVSDKYTIREESAYYLN